MTPLLDGFDKLDRTDLIFTDYRQKITRLPINLLLSSLNTGNTDLKLVWQVLVYALLRIAVRHRD